MQKRKLGQGGLEVSAIGYGCMGHKEDLLAGAKQVLVERGYANATARDIVAASKTNLA